MSEVKPVHRSHKIASCRPEEAFDVVSDFEAYPRLFAEISSAKVLERVDNRVRVEFRMSLVLPIRYVLDLVCDRATLRIDWTLVEADVMTRNQGAWRFTATGADTTLDYEIALDLRAPVPGFVLRKVTDGLVNLSLPAMFKAIEKEVKARQAG